jgi:AraC family transcriptional regulator of adaptative response / DNA-3-methyladenine glycosylase II
MEFVEHGIYRRTVSHEAAHGMVAVAHAPDRHALIATIHFPCVRALHPIVSRVRHVFDVGADVSTITAHLARDKTLAPLIAARPGLRTPGCWDGFELAVRAVLGQQITVEAARQLGSKLVLLCGDPVATAADPRPARTFPSARCVATADLSTLPMPQSRRATLKALAQAAVANPRLFGPGSIASIEDSLAQLRAIRGIGEWTAQYIALRALREPDAFPATDIGILRGAASLDGVLLTAPQLIQRAEAWRPWRAYAAQYLWTAAHTTLQQPREARHAE